LKKPSKSNKDKLDREARMLTLLLHELPLNPIPWVTVIRLVAPVIARLAVRMVLKKVSRSLAEDKVNAIGDAVSDSINLILESRREDNG